MAIQVDALPKTFNSEFSEIGQFPVTIGTSEMTTSRNTGVPQLVVDFITPGGKTIKEYYQDSDKPFMQFKLGRLIDALELTSALAGSTVQLGDIHTLVHASKGKQVLAHLNKDDRGYGQIDYSRQAGGLGIEHINANNPVGETVESLMATVEDLGNAPKLDITQDTVSAFAQPSTPATPANKPNFNPEGF